MSKYIRFATIFLCLLLLTSTGLPSGKKDYQPIMKIGRSVDANEIHYFIHLNENGSLSKNQPIQLYWANYKEKNGQLEQMNWIKEKFGYGLKYLKIEDEEAVFQFVSYEKRTFILKKYRGNYRIFTKSFNKWVLVDRIYIEINGGSFWLPKIDCAKLYAHNINDNQHLVEIIKP
jgi:hypothetical protein